MSVTIIEKINSEVNTMTSRALWQIRAYLRTQFDIWCYGNACVADEKVPDPRILMHYVFKDFGDDEIEAIRLLEKTCNASKEAGRFADDVNSLLAEDSDFGNWTRALEELWKMIEGRFLKGADVPMNYENLVAVLYEDIERKENDTLRTPVAVKSLRIVRLADGIPVYTKVIRNPEVLASGVVIPAKTHELIQELAANPKTKLIQETDSPIGLLRLIELRDKLFALR